MANSGFARECLPNLRIKNVSDNYWIDLNNYGHPLSQYPEFTRNSVLIAEDKGWLLDIPCCSVGEMAQLAELFAMKSHLIRSDYIRSPTIVLPLSFYSESSWRDAYKIPVVIVGGKAIDCRSILPSFGAAKMFSCIRDDFEFSFVINNNLSRLNDSDSFPFLRSSGFREHDCLVNLRFLQEQVDFGQGAEC